MELTGLHIMLTWQCILECDHCFVWGSPHQQGTWRLKDLHTVLDQAMALGSIRWIYYEGGEPFLYYPLLLQAVQAAGGRGFQVGLVTNGYWAVDPEDARVWLQPLAGLVQDLSVSSDCYHWDERLSQQARHIQHAAQALDIPFSVLSVAQPGDTVTSGDEGVLMLRGRAAARLAPYLPGQPWSKFTRCPFEDLRQPGRVHLDPFGNLHLCQGICLGNVLQTPLGELYAAYQADAHPIIGPLLAGGPAELARHYQVTVAASYADACHLCYHTRLALRAHFPDILAPDGMYGVS